MKLRRRTFLGMTTATVAGSVLTGPVRADGSPFTPFVLILSGCDPKVNPETLFNIIDPIASYNIPVGIAVELPPTPNSAQDALDAYVDVLTRMTSNLPGLIELMPEVASLNNSIAYFMARRAFDAYGRHQATFNAAPGQAPVSLFSRGAENGEAGFAGIRSSGFRSAFTPGTDIGATLVQPVPNGVLNISGGIVADATVPIEAFRDSLDLAIQSEDSIFLNLSLAGLTDLSPERAFQQGSELAVAIARRKALSQIVPVLPRDFHLRLAGSHYDRAISVCVDMTTGKDDVTASYAEFISMLEPLSIRPTRIVSGQDTPLDSASGNADAAPVSDDTCPVLDMVAFFSDSEHFENGANRPKCAAVTSAADQDLPEASSIGLSTLLDVSRSIGRTCGLDDNGILRIPAAARISGGSDTASLDIAGKLPGLIGNHRDAIVVIDARSISTSSGRNLIFKELSDLAAQPWSTYKTLEGFSNAAVPNFNYLELIRQSKFDRYVEARETQSGGPENNTRLMEHARLAWQYFANETHEKTGFTPATVFRSDDFKSNYEVVTMWDVTSHLNGALCAAELGIITRDDMLERVTRILKNLPSRKNVGLKLPVAEFHYASGNPLSTEYNSCDTGRLLVSLHLLSRLKELKDTVTGLVGGWDLAQTVKQGKIMDIAGGRMVDASRTNCSHYAGIGYRLWGIESESAYTTPHGEGSFDQGIRLLNAVGNIGVYGAEPLLLEAVELGFSPESKILADVLYSAQLAEYRRSGTLVAVSETPLDREPWFIYQGLDVNSADDPWKVFSIVNEARFKTAGFTYANRMFCTKAAFLWGAVRPGDFSDKLVARAVKDTGLPDLGFAVGVYQATDQPTFGYSGMNTNGIILEAIAYSMRGFKPMSEAEF